MKTAKKIRFISHGAAIAAIYVVLTYITNAFGLASGVIQCRFSEALCVLPAFTPAAIPGLFIGCFLSNLLTGSVIFDVIFGSLATLLGAIGTYYLSKKSANEFLFPLPCILANTLIIPFVLKIAYGAEGGLMFFFATVGLGEIISCGVLGMVLFYYLKKNKHKLF